MLGAFVTHTIWYEFLRDVIVADQCQQHFWFASSGVLDMENNQSRKECARTGKVASLLVRLSPQIQLSSPASQDPKASYCNVFCWRVLF
jgi:hypothetical protein